MNLSIKADNIDVETVRTIIGHDLRGTVYAPYGEPENVFESHPEDSIIERSVHEGDGFYNIEVDHIDTPEGYDSERYDWFEIDIVLENDSMIIKNYVEYMVL